MDEMLIKNWNACVQPDDSVYHLGDFAFSKIDRIKEILRQLNGIKYFIHGNHDSEILENAESLLDEGLFARIDSYREIKIQGQQIVLFHYGCRVWNRAHHGAYLLFGHSHGELPPYGKSVDVGTDAKFITKEYRPVSFEEVREFMNKQNPITHHKGD